MNAELPSPDERHQAALEDGSGASSYVSRGRYGPPTEEENEQAIIQRHAKSHTRHPAGHYVVAGPGGADVSRIIAHEYAKKHPDTRPEDERRESYKRGAAAVRAALPTPTSRALAKFDAEIQMADPDYRDRDIHAAELALNAQMRKIAEENEKSSH